MYPSSRPPFEQESLCVESGPSGVRAKIPRGHELHQSLPPRRYATTSSRSVQLGPEVPIRHKMQSLATPISKRPLCHYNNRLCPRRRHRGSVASLGGRPTSDNYGSTASSGVPGSRSHRRIAAHAVENRREQCCSPGRACFRDVVAEGMARKCRVGRE